MSSRPSACGRWRRLQARHPDRGNTAPRSAVGSIYRVSCALHFASASRFWGAWSVWCCPPLWHTVFSPRRHPSPFPSGNSGGDSVVLDSETSDFSARSRKARVSAEAYLSTPHKEIRCLTPRLQKSAVSGRELARISHQLPATACDAPHPAEFSRLGVLDVLSSTTPRPSDRKHHWTRHLTDLATKAGEKRGLTLFFSLHADSAHHGFRDHRGRSKA